MSAFRLRAVIALSLVFLTVVNIPTLAVTDVASTGWEGTSRNFKGIIAQSTVLDVPYVDAHYGSADGIIDPTEYAFRYTDPTSRVTIYMEHNSTVLFMGLSSPAGGWVGAAWQAPNGTFTVAGLNNSDIVMGYAPGNPYTQVRRVTQNDVVTVQYKLYLRNGTLFQQGYAPSESSQTPLKDENLLQAYKDAIIGMRVGEVKRFIIPAAQAYTKPTDTLYGEDLEYVVTLIRIGEDYNNPAESGAVVRSDRHGIGTFAHAQDSDQSLIIRAGATGTSSFTHVEFFIRMNSTDPFDIPLLNGTNSVYPMVLMYGTADDFSTLPTQHTDWSSPLLVRFVPNEFPKISLESPLANETLRWALNLRANVTDNTLVRRVSCKLNNESWVSVKYDFQTHLWTLNIDITKYEGGNYTLYVNATDASGKTSLVSMNVTIGSFLSPLRGMILGVTRTITTMVYHQVSIADLFTVTNNGSAPIGAIEYYLPTNYRDYLLSISAKDSEDKTLSVVRLPDSDSFMCWRVYFFRSVGYGSDYRLTVTTHLHSVQRLVNFTENLFELRVLRYPLVPHLLTRAALSFALKSGESIQGTSPEGVRKNIAPMTHEELVIVLKSIYPYLTAVQHSEIVLDAWGWISYKETITITNHANSKENTIPLIFPAFATYIRIYDRVGLLSNSMPSADREWNSTLSHTVNLMRDRFGENGFRPKTSYTFYVEYSVLLSKHSKPTTNGMSITLPMTTLGDLLVVEHVVDLRVAPSVSIVEIAGDYRLLYGFHDYTLRFVGYNSTVQNPLEISLTYNVSAGVLLRPVLFAALIGSVMTVYVVYRRRRHEATETTPVEPTVSSAKQALAPPDVIKSFTDAYSKRTALELEYEKLQTDQSRGKVTRKEFMIRERDLKAQLDETTEKITKLKEKLMSYGARYRDIVGQLELQDEKVAGAKAGLKQLAQRRKTQRMSHAAYEKTRQDYLKTIKQAVATTDRILLSLLEEAGEI